MKTSTLISCVVDVVVYFSYGNGQSPELCDAILPSLVVKCML